MGDEVPLRKLIEIELNRRCAENGSNTPDFILAEYLIDCLKTWDRYTKKRDNWYGVHLEPCNKYFNTVSKQSTIKSIRS